MNKKELLDLVNTLDLPKEEYSILSGGALLLHGLREQTNDLDIDITEEGLDKLKENFAVELINESNKQYKVTDSIECFLVDKLDSDINFIDNYLCQSLISIYNFKKKLNREKDQKDILAIERFFNIK